MENFYLITKVEVVFGATDHRGVITQASVHKLDTGFYKLQ